MISTTTAHTQNVRAFREAATAYQYTFSGMMIRMMSASQFEWPARPLTRTAASPFNDSGSTKAPSTPAPMSAIAVSAFR